MIDYPLVKVTWHDAQEAGSGWLDLEDCEKAPLAVCTSVGWLLALTSTKIVVAATLSQAASEEPVTQGGDCTAIPRDWAIKIEYLDNLREEIENGQGI